MPKITVPSPTVMHFRGGRGAYIDADAIIPDVAAFYDDLARPLSRGNGDLGKSRLPLFVRSTRSNLAYLLRSGACAKQVTNIGEESDGAAADLRQSFSMPRSRTVPPGMTVCMHLCRGKLRRRMGSGGRRRTIAELIFTEIGMDGYFLEYDSPRADHSNRCGVSTQR